VEVAFALSDDSNHLMALELFDLPPPLVVAAATVAIRSCWMPSQHPVQGLAPASERLAKIVDATKDLKRLEGGIRV
jgi:hypothetical protein